MGFSLPFANQPNDKSIFTLCDISANTKQTEKCLFLAHLPNVWIFPFRSQHIFCYLYRPFVRVCLYIFLYYFICVGSDVKSIFILTPMWIQFSIWIYSSIHAFIHSDQSIVCCCCRRFFLFVCLWRINEIACPPACQSACSLIRPYTVHTSLIFFVSRPCTVQNVLI